MESDLQTQIQGHCALGGGVCMCVCACAHTSLLFPCPLPLGWAGDLRVTPGLAVPSCARSDNSDPPFSTSVHFNCPKIDDRCKENNEA